MIQRGIIVPEYEEVTDEIEPSPTEVADEIEPAPTEATDPKPSP
jgi:hypothetical protein